MAASDPNAAELAEISRTWLARFGRMSVRARAMRGDRTVIASLPLSDRTFPGLEGPVHIPQVMIATVGRDRIKCVKPHALFALPMINLSGCRSATAIEVRIRTAWTQHIEQLNVAYSRLRDLEAPIEVKEPDSIIRIDVEGEGSDVWARMIDDQFVILPGRGPLSRVALHDRDERLLFLDPSLTAGIELQIAISTRLEELADRAKREALEFRHANASNGIEISAPRVTVRSHRVMLVGPRLIRDRKLADSLGLRGYIVVTARSANEALRLYHGCSPELVLTDADLGRSEGLELVPMLRELAGVEDIPVIVVDVVRHEARRRAARAIGATGYLVQPIDVARIAERLRFMVDEPRRRRFTRYPEPIAVRVLGARSPATATALSRGGFYLCSEDDFPARTLHECELVLPDSGRSVQVEAEVLYRLGQSGHSMRGVGLRFERFGADGEPAFLEFLEGLDAV